MASGSTVVGLAARAPYGAPEPQPHVPAAPAAGTALAADSPPAMPLYPQPAATHSAVVADPALFMRLLERLHGELAGRGVLMSFGRAFGKFRVPVGESQEAPREDAVSQTAWHLHAWRARSCCMGPGAHATRPCSATRPVPWFVLKLHGLAAPVPRVRPRRRRSNSLQPAMPPSSPKHVQHDTVCGQKLDLHTLYARVTGLGGLEAVITTRAWSDVCEPFGFPPSFTSKSFTVRKLYSQHLHHFEQVYFHRRGGQPLVP